MTTVGEFFNLQKVSGTIGVEIEAEGRLLPNPDTFPILPIFSRYWKIERDPSLRGEAWEYVLNKPLPLPFIPKALKALKEQFKETGSSMYESHRAGVHVHINVQDMTALELATYVTAYMCMEEILVGFCGKARVGNHFCLRMKDAYYTVYALTKMFGENLWTYASDENIRYCSLNMNSLKKYGSVEFRSMRSTPDFNEINIWVKVLYDLKKGSTNFNNPREVVEFMSDGGAVELAETLVGKDNLELLRVKDVHQEVLSGVRSAQDFAYNCNWDKVSFPVKKRVDV